MILFRTPGTLAAEALTTFGLTSKDETQIGRFGTGLKYATAIVLREGGSIRIRSDAGEHRIGIEPGMFRNKPVAFATIDGTRLPFTTELGRDWKPWMAFREFYANTVDEGGVFERCFSEPAPRPGHTDLLVECPALDAVHDNFEEYFIDPEEKPLARTPGLDIYPGESAQVFYQGFAVLELPERARFRYNIRHPLDLTEDRTAASIWSVLARIESGLCAVEDEAVLTEALAATAPFESSLEFPLWDEASAAFLGVVDKLGDAASAPAALLAAHTRHRAAKNSGEILERADASSSSLMHAVACMRLMEAPIEGWRFAYSEIPTGAHTETDAFRKIILISNAHRESEKDTLRHLLTAFIQQHQSWGLERLLRLAYALSKKLEA